MNKSDRICLWKETELTGYPDLNAFLYLKKVLESKIEQKPLRAVGT